MLTSKKVLEYLKKNVSDKNIASMFVAGSLPEKLLPGSDLDIICVIKEEKKNEFFENIIAIMDELLKNQKNITYTFFRGPIKLEKDGLIHFVIYTESEKQDFQDREQFVGESRPVLKGFLSNNYLLKGKSVEELTKEVDFLNTEISEKDLNNMLKKRKILLEKGTINYPLWNEINGDWTFSRKEIKANSFLKQYLLKYYEKNINKAKKNLS